MDIYDIYKLLGLKKENDHSYFGTFCTGRFDGMHDYGAGILCIHINAYKVSVDSEWTVMFSIGTIDDGAWQAFDVRNDYTKEDAANRVKTISESFIEFMGGSNVLPTEKELNDFLMQHALWGEFTG